MYLNLNIYRNTCLDAQLIPYICARENECSCGASGILMEDYGMPFINRVCGNMAETTHSICKCTSTQS